MTERLPNSPEQHERERLDAVVCGIVELNDWFVEVGEVAHRKGAIADGFERVAQHCEALARLDPYLRACLIEAFRYRPDLDLHFIADRLRED